MSAVSTKRFDNMMKRIPEDLHKSVVSFMNIVAMTAFDNGWDEGHAAGVKDADPDFDAVQDDLETRMCEL